MEALVTGGTGLLGGSIVRELVERGHQVKALARSREKATRLLADLPVDVVEGDIADVSAFGPALDGCDVVFHTAAYFREYYRPGDHWETLRRLNVDAVMELIGECERRGVPRLVHTSSSGVIGSPPGGVGDESAEPGEIAERNLYFKSKVHAERAIAEYLRDGGGVEVVIALPGWMFGPGDAAPTDSGRLVIDYCNRKLPGLIPGGGNTADARDVARGMIAAAELGGSGERYILAGDFNSIIDIAGALHDVTGVRPPRLRLPISALVAAATVSDALARITGRDPLITRSAVETMRSVHMVSADKASRELGTKFRPLRDTLRDEVAWFRANGMLAPAS
jgi:dihydroflavonol-4-reductase